MALRKAIIDGNWDDIPKNLTSSKAIQEWAKGKFTVDGNVVKYEGNPLPTNLNKRIIDMASKGEDPTSMMNFYERLQKNPSKRSVDQLFSFLDHSGIPFTKDGCFLAYKAVQSNYKDVHSGKFDNSPGTTNKMPRNQISDDPREACHEGFHVGALGYARTFHTGGHIVVCKVAPENVVCVPYDSSQQKMRVCEYTVVGNHNGQLLPDTSFESDSYDPNEDDFTAEEEANDAAAEEAIEASAKVFYDATKKKSEEQKRTSKKGFAKFDKMEMEDLMKCSIDELRQYAGKGLEIIGASKIPGGKLALVSRIIEVRK